MEQTLVDAVVAQIMARLAQKIDEPVASFGIPVGVSNRHIHLSPEHLITLFGKGYLLTIEKELKQTGEFAAKETVTLVGSKGVIRGVRVLGPVRNFTQVELSKTDGFSLGVVPPVRDSGAIDGSPGVVVVGPAGAVTLNQGVICAARHIHMSPEDAQRFGVADKDRVSVEIAGCRAGIFSNVLVRVNPNFRLEFHIDTDEANAFDLKNGDLVILRKNNPAVFRSREQPSRMIQDASEEKMSLPDKKKAIVDAEAVKKAVSSGDRTIIIQQGTIITPLARDLAREYKVDFSFSAQ